MNTIINTYSLPEEIIDCYIKWSEITGIDSSEQFFNDILLSSEMGNYHSFILNHNNDCIGKNSDCFTLVNIDEGKLTLYDRDKDHIYQYMKDFIISVNKIYENNKR